MKLIMRKGGGNRVRDARTELSRLLSQSVQECTEVYGGQNGEIGVY